MRPSNKGTELLEMSGHRSQEPVEELTLDDALAEMQRLAAMGDTEVAHAEADDLLIDIMTSIARPEDAEIVSQIAQVFYNMPKWYA